MVNVRISCLLMIYTLLFSGSLGQMEIVSYIQGSNPVIKVHSLTPSLIMPLPRTISKSIFYT